MSSAAASGVALPRAYFLQDTVHVAKSLLNCVLTNETDAGTVAGRITETEAYTQDDPASHAFRGKTPRNAPMFGPPGHAYVYLSYGMHFCFNAVTAPEGQGEAVLIRAVEPIEGWELMSRRRGLAEEEIRRLAEMATAPAARVRWGRTLCGGPGKLCQAFGVTRAEDGADLTVPTGLWIGPPRADFPAALPDAICASPRIGIRQAADAPWRFTLRDDPYISKR
jgi:DNA-3-methyladenine glycosylase